MASKPRNFNPKSYYHIYNRAVEEKEKIFLSNNDYQRFLNTIIYYIPPQTIPFAIFQRLPPQRRAFANPKGLIKRAKLLAYVLMPNHFHFLVKPAEEDPAALSRFLSDLTNSYTRYFNLKYQRKGVLFQSTFQAKEISDEGSLLQVSRYIHLNPLQSTKTNPKGLLKVPQNYLYSSYHEWSGFKNPHLIDANETQFWIEKIGGTREYRKFVEAQLSKDTTLGIEHLILE